MPRRVYRKRMWTVILLNVALVVSLTVRDSRPSDRFRGMKVGVKGGVYQHNARTLINTTALGETRQDSVTLSGHNPFFGMQFEVDFPWISKMYMGGAIGYEGSQGHVQSKMTSTIPNSHFKMSLKQKIEVALIMGMPYHDIFPYFKIGTVWGQVHMRANNGTGKSNVKEFRPGFLVGTGLDFNLGPQWLWGALVQYEQYNRIKSHFVRNDGATPLSFWSMRPSLMSVQIHLKRKLN